METSDDVGSLFGGGDSDPVELPSQKAENVSRTAVAQPQGSESARKRRQQASSLTQGFAPAKLSQPGLLGLGQR